MSLTLVKMLYCGQGMTTLVEVYGDGKTPDGPADYLALVDCGGDHGADAVDYIAEKVCLSRRLDLVVISHQDGDHLELLKDLGPKIPKGVVGKIFAGGRDWDKGKKKKKNTEVVRNFASCVNYSDDVRFNMERESHYDTPNKLGFLGEHGDVKVRLLITNLNASFKAKNGSSAVVVIEDGRQAVVLPGDATYETMQAVSGILKRDRSLLPSVTAIALPHHGAINTAVPNYSPKMPQDKIGWEILNEFVATLGSPRAAASAEAYHLYGHPKWEIIKKFNLPSTAQAHSFTSFAVYPPSPGDDHPQGWYTNRDSRLAFWTTVEDLGSDPMLPLPKRAKVSPLPITRPGRGAKAKRARSSPPLLCSDIEITLSPPGIRYSGSRQRTAPTRVADVMILAPAP